MPIRLLASMLTALVLATALLAQQPAPNPPRSLLEKLYRLVWPAGRFSGDLVKAVTDSSQKGSPSTGYTRLFLIDARARRDDVKQPREMEWKGSVGARDPIVCASDSSLYYRRGTSVVREPLRVKSGMIESAAAAAPLTGAAVATLVACTSAESGPVLWAELPDGTAVHLMRRNSELLPDTSHADPELSASSPRDLVDALRVLRSLRPNGVTATIINGSLIAREPGREDTLLVDSPDAHFIGVPSWVLDESFLFAVQEDPQ